MKVFTVWSCANPNQEAEYQMKILCKKLIKNV